MTNNTVDVLVVGAGPVGLFCANELTRHGLRCRIIDKKTTLSDKSKALGIHIRTLDMLDDCGLLDQVVAAGHPVEGILFKSKGRVLVDANLADMEVNQHFIIDLPQDKTEHILHAALVNKGITVDWQTELTQVSQTTQEVHAVLTHGDGSTENISSTWLIACDGAHSTVRHLSNMSFAGAEYKQHWWLADVLIDWALPDNRMIIYFHREGPLACFPMGEKRYRVGAMAPLHHEGEPSFADIEALFTQRSSDAAKLSHPVWITKFSIHHRQIEHYRSNRIFFAGDAAHIHSPLGGQGLNTGMQDIYNLIWKLALVHKGLARDDLLHSYHLERYPVGQEILRKTDKMTKMAVLANPWAISLRNRFISTLMSLRWIRKKIAHQMAELDISYRKSPIVKSFGHAKHLKAGHFLANFNLCTYKEKRTESLNNIVRGTMHHLFLFKGLESSDLLSLIEVLHFVKEKYPLVIVPHFVLNHDIPHLDCAATVWLDDGQIVHHKYAISQPMILLLRPDKYIGFIQMPLEKDALMHYLAKLFV